MSCRRAYDIDLTAFLADPRNPAHADFREHYPRCAECAAEVRAWTEVESLLRAPDAHPAPEKLLRLEEDRDALGAVERAALEDHVAQCASCRDELAALRGFEPHAATASGRAHAGGTSALGALLAGLRGLLVQPAFAYALALLFAAPTVYRLVTSDSDLLRQTPVESAAKSEPAVESREEQAAPAANVTPMREAKRKNAPPSGLELERTRPARAKSAAVLRDEAEQDAPLPETVPPSQIEKQRLRALGYVTGEPADAPTELRAAEAAPAEPRAAEKASAVEPQAAEGFASGALSSADAARSADAAPPANDVMAMQQETAAPPRPVLAPSGPGVYRLRVPLEPRMHEVEIRVSPPGEGRLIAEHFRGAAGEVSVEIPAAWIVPGTWHIERRALGRRDVFELQVP